MTLLPHVFQNKRERPQILVQYRSYSTETSILKQFHTKQILFVTMHENKQNKNYCLALYFHWKSDDLMFLCRSLFLNVSEFCTVHIAVCRGISNLSKQRMGDHTAVQKQLYQMSMQTKINKICCTPLSVFPIKFHIINSPL